MAQWVRGVDKASYMIRTSLPQQTDMMHVGLRDLVLPLT
jgi:hypothetical protein